MQGGCVDMDGRIFERHLYERKTPYRPRAKRKVGRVNKKNV